MKNILIKGIKIICFLLLFVCLLLKFHKIFNFKQGDPALYSLSNFYKQPENSIDVMFLGTSHVYENINTAILYDEYGIAAYDLCGSGQTIWNTYYYMKEALKTQTPKLLVVDMYAMTQIDEYSNHGRIVKNNFALKLSEDKIESVKVSAPREKWLNYLLEYPIYHSRYSELTRDDFVTDREEKLLDTFKGFETYTATTAFTKTNDFYTEETVDFIEKGEEYLYKIIELAKEKQIPLLFVKSPYIVMQEHQKRFNKVSEVAEEENIPFINFNFLYDELELNFETDFEDFSHLNYLGNVKYTRYLANYIKSNYDIPNRKGDPSYQSYEKMVKHYKQQIYNFELTETKDFHEYVSKLHNEDYIVVCSVYGDYKNAENYSDVREELLALGIDLGTVNHNTVWVIKNGELLFSSSAIEPFCWYMDVSKYDTLMTSFEMGAVEGIEINLNNTIYKAVEQGINILVYDTETESVVEDAGFSFEGGRFLYEKTE